MVDSPDAEKILTIARNSSRKNVIDAVISVTIALCDKRGELYNGAILRYAQDTLIIHRGYTDIIDKDYKDTGRDSSILWYAYFGYCNHLKFLLSQRPAYDLDSLVSDVVKFFMDMFSKLVIEANILKLKEDKKWSLYSNLNISYVYEDLKYLERRLKDQLDCLVRTLCDIAPEEMMEHLEKFNSRDLKG